MFGLGWSETVVLLVLGLIVIGPKQLPEVAKSLGRIINDLKRTAAGLKNEMSSITSEDLFAERPKPPELTSPNFETNHATDPYGHPLDGHPNGHPNGHPDGPGDDPHNPQLAFDLNAPENDQLELAPASETADAGNGEKKKSDG
jgi:Tat protein translocase TatB subunit